MRKFFYALVLNFFGLLYAGPILIYNQYPRVWNMDFKEMTRYVHKIKDLGFNVVWVNPFFQTSDTVVKRFNKFTGEELDVKGSLYAMKLDGLPPIIIPSDKEEAIKEYTRTIRNHKMIPIFDLVLNHIAKGSSIIDDHPTWVKKQDSHWDDIYPFNYTEGNREEIFKAIWNHF